MHQALAPRIAAFPKCYMDDLCVSHTLSLLQWIDMSGTLSVDGLEMYPGFFPSLDRSYLSTVHSALQRQHLLMPMLCASPDFIQQNAALRLAEVERYKRMIDLVAFFDAPAPRTCRLLSGQRQPNVSEDDGVAMVIECIEQVLPYAAEHGVVLALENHYKDNYWTYPEFAQSLHVFLRIVNAITSPWFGVNYDPSNALLAGEDPLVVLDAVKARVVSMHASDRSIQPGYSINDVRIQQDRVGYSPLLHHGEIGTGLNDFAAIFRLLYAVGFTGWISIEDGMNGLDELRRSADFLRTTVAQIWK